MKLKERKLKIALFYPWIKSRGGAEKVLLEIMKIKDFNFDLYTWVYDEKDSFKEFKNLKINVIGSNILRKLSKMKLLRGLFLPFSLFSKIPLEKYDYFLIYTSGTGEFITFRNYKKGKTIGYVNTILRDAYPEIVKWNMKNIYKNVFSRIIYLASVKIYRFFEKIAWKRIDFPIFISEEGFKRAEKQGLLKNKKAKVIYVPVDTSNFLKLPSNKGSFFLYVSRFNPPKRQDLLIKAWIKFSKKYPNEKLILSGGLENKKYFEYIKKLSESAKNIDIKEGLDNEKILKLYGKSKAVIFVPFLEDFGIVPFEALATGKPIIAVDKGGYVDLIKGIPQYYPIKEAENEDLFVENIANSLKKFMKSNIKPKKINIKNISPQNFKKDIMKVFR
ncbi:MAG: glycosyltransferase [Candidatus Diapherotrites archaeon]